MDDTLAKSNAKLTSFYTKHSRMPSYSEAAEVLGYKSKDSAFKIIQKLITAGYLKKDSKGKLIPGRLAQKYNQKTNQRSNEPQALKLLGLVEAGFPTPSEETDLDDITLDEWLIRDKDRSFMLKVKGDSMIDAGIQPGDYVIVERTSSASTGSIVISDVDGSWTMKYLRKDKSGYYLEAANSKYDIIRPENDLHISAVVTALVRKYV